MKPPEIPRMKRTVGPLFEIRPFDCGSAQDTETLTLHCPVLRTGGPRRRGWRGGGGCVGVASWVTKSQAPKFSSEAPFPNLGRRPRRLPPPTGLPRPNLGRPQPNPPFLWEWPGPRSLPFPHPFLPAPGPPCHTLVNSSSHKVVCHYPLIVQSFIPSSFLVKD